MNKLWAVVAPDGTLVIRVSEGHPAEHGHADECEGKTVFLLEREPNESIGETVDPITGKIVLNHDFVLAQLRTERDLRLDASDKLMLPDRGFSEEMQQAILGYREALRNITDGDIHNPQWPADPTVKEK